MSAISHRAAHEISRDLGCFVSSVQLARSEGYVQDGLTNPIPSFFALARRWRRRIHNHVRYRQTVRSLRRMPRCLLNDLGIRRSEIREVAAAMVMRERGGER